MQDCLLTREFLRADQQRGECLRNLRELLAETCGDSPSARASLTQEGLSAFLSNNRATENMFGLFDHESRDSLDQARWLEIIRTNLARCEMNEK